MRQIVDEYRDMRIRLGALFTLSDPFSFYSEI